MHVNQIRIVSNKWEKKTENSTTVPAKTNEEAVGLWEEKQSLWKLEDLSKTAVEKLLQKINKAECMKIDESDEHICRKLFLTDREWLNNAGAVLLCETPYAELQMAVCRGKDRFDLALQKRIKGNVFENIDAAETFIEEQTEGYPMEAVHEILCNAFCHRDYNSTQCNEVVIYDDELEIFNPGELPQSYDFNDFCVNVQRPVPRNPLIARVLYYTGDQCGMGLGLKKVQQICKDSGVKVCFHQDKGGVVVVLKGGHKRTIRNKYGFSLNNHEQNILDYLSNHSWVTNASAREIVGVGTTAARNLLNGLADKGFLIAEGENRGRKYYLSDSINDHSAEEDGMGS